ncbi:MAG TPA: hypothetical protein VK547_05610, partial [Candidatus Udaeobacter sp.]|nr:hypothetical protein [Candidatus Udaeobacter sp.]
STAKASNDDRATNASPRHDQRSSSDERLREGAEPETRNHPRSSEMEDERQRREEAKPHPNSSSFKLHERALHV